MTAAAALALIFGPGTVANAATPSITTFNELAAAFTNATNNSTITLT